MNKRIRYKYKVVNSDDYSFVTTTTKYRKLYKKGTIVKATPGSDGIMLFKRKVDALIFLGPNRAHGKIKRVITYGPGKRITIVCENPGNTRMMNRYYSAKKKINIDSLSSSDFRAKKTFIKLMIYAPSNTWGYEAVKVID